MLLDLPDEDVDFVMQVLQQQPLPYVRTAPIIRRVAEQIVAFQEQAKKPLAVQDGW